VVAGDERKSIEDVYSALSEFAGEANSGQLTLHRYVISAQEPARESPGAELRLPDDNYHASLRDAHRAPANGDPHSTDDDLLTLRNYVSEIAGDQSKSTKIQLAQAAKPDPWAPAVKKSDSAGRSNPAPAAKKVAALDGYATSIGSETCLMCHATQAASFAKTLMGRIKTGCETCHGPGSQHVKAVGCSGCHGEAGVSNRPGMPSLVGQEPQYLVSAMKAYVTGQRKHDLMRAVLSSVGGAELNDIALYYARQVPARAQTPPVGDASAGKAATASCAACHGAQGVSINPAFPSLAGQDARYLADALKAYKHGSRNKSVACSACHGEGGISKRPGVPSLVGLDPEYLVSAMKAYVTGQRKHDFKKTLLSGVSEAELNDIAHYYAQQSPARAQTPLVGDASAGKTASASCAECHGEEGVSTNSAWPSLAGQDARYLADALKAYKSGSRKSVLMKGPVESLDERTINDMASYYASLRPARPTPAPGTQTVAAKRDPILVRNGLVAHLDEGTINNIASYYASLPPAQPGGARNAPATHDPVLIGTAARADGRSLGGIVSFRDDDKSRTVAEKNGICLGCHDKGDRAIWGGSTHETRGLACTNCHSVMKNLTPKHQLAKTTEIDTCVQCHKNKRAEIWRSSHMPIAEGKMTCTSCHNPHGSVGDTLLKEATVNDTCYKCHAEKRGPFLWEHAPVRENCLNCHDPHGSNNDFLLKISRPRLCQQCHSALGGHPANPRNPSSVFAIGRACQNCHSQHHGSNSPSGARFQR
jgi:DmsE family decaheme c-type cytochrome